MKLIRNCMKQNIRCNYCSAMYLLETPKDYRKLKWSGNWGSRKCPTCKQKMYIRGEEQWHYKK